MKIYIVENGNFIGGYYRNRENAEAAVEENDRLIEKYKHLPNLDTKPCYVTEIDTVD